MKSLVSKVLIGSLCAALAFAACAKKPSEAVRPGGGQDPPHRRHPQGDDPRVLEVDPRRRGPGGARARRQDHLEGAAERGRPGPADHRRRGLHQPRRRRHRARAARRPGAHASGPGRRAGEDPGRHHRLRAPGERLRELRRHGQLQGRRPGRPPSRRAPRRQGADLPHPLPGGLGQHRPARGRLLRHRHQGVPRHRHARQGPVRRGDDRDGLPAGREPHQPLPRRRRRLHAERIEHLRDAPGPPGIPPRRQGRLRRLRQLAQARPGSPRRRHPGPRHPEPGQDGLSRRQDHRRPPPRRTRREGHRHRRRPGHQGQHGFPRDQGPPFARPLHDQD